MIHYEFYFANGMVLKGECDSYEESKGNHKPAIILKHNEYDKKSNLIVFVDECTAYRFQTINTKGD